jgi:photosystem II stability/assembly factor-like uncharacterized protein
MTSPTPRAAFPPALFLLLSAAPLFVAMAPNAARADWTPAGPWYGQVNVLATSPAAVYAGTEAAVWKTENQGATWEPKSAGLPLARVTALIVSPFDSALLLAGTGGAGIHRSTDGGESWLLASGAAGAVADFAVTAAGIFYAATGAGTLRSTDAGATWNAAGLDGLEVRALVCQRLDGFLFAVLGAGDVRRSTDDGESWVPAAAGLGGTNVYTLAAHPDSAATLYAGGLGFGADGDLYKTTNSGVSWQRITSPVFPSFLIVNDLAFDAAGGSVVYVAAYGDGVLKTTNGGATWMHASAGLGDLETLALAAAPAPGAVFAATQRRSVFSTVNGGGSWEEAGTGISGMQTLAIETDLAGDRIWTGNRTGIVLSADGGATWIFSDFEGDIGAQANAIARDPQVAGRLWAGTSNAFFKGDVLRSTNGGLSWTIAYSPSGGPVLDVVVDPEAPQFIHAAFTRDVIPGGVARSTNGGLTWTEVAMGDVGVQCLAHDPGAPLRLLAGTDLGLEESLDHGASFHAFAPDLAGVSIRDVIFSGLVPDVVFVATETIGVYRSTDGGGTFAAANGGMGTIEVRQLALRDGGAGSRILLAATAAGCYRSADDGVSWSLENDGLLVSDARAVSYLPEGLLFLGTEGAGVWAQPEIPTGIGSESPAAPPVRFALTGARPDPIVGPEGARFGLSLAGASRVELAVYDAAGRAVRRFPMRQLPAGSHEIRWDGRDDAGHPVASGVYFLRADFGGQAPAVAERVAVIR